MNYTDTHRRHPGGRVPARGATGAPTRNSARRLLFDQAALRQPQRRQPRLRARRLPLHRHRRRRQRRRPARQRPEPRTPCSARSCASTSTAARRAARTRIPPTTRSRGRRARREIYAYGLRNPWRFSFDRDTRRPLDRRRRPGRDRGGRLPGQGRGARRQLRLERLRGPLAATTAARGARPAADAAGAPQYTHAEGCSVTGGYVYRGTKVPALAGPLRLRRLLLRQGVEHARRPQARRRPRGDRPPRRHALQRDVVRRGRSPATSTCSPAARSTASPAASAAPCRRGPAVERLGRGAPAAAAVARRGRRRGRARRDRRFPRWSPSR